VHVLTPIDIELRYQIWHVKQTALVTHEDRTSAVTDPRCGAPVNLITVSVP